MSNKDVILQVLDKMGYKPELDDEGDIMFCYQMKTIFVFFGDENEHFISVMLPQFHEIADGEETLVLAVCNKITREMKLAKVYIDQTFKNVSASCEFFYSNKETLEQCLTYSLDFLGVVRSVFRKNMAELSEE